MNISTPLPEGSAYLDTEIPNPVDRKNAIAPRGGSWPWLLLLLILLFSGYYLLDGDQEIAPGLIETPEGDLVLSPERQAKWERELGEIDNAVQYALIATRNREYTCLSCPFGLKTVYLRKGEVWKYGVTRIGKARRYANDNFGTDRVSFLPMFRGTYSECLKREKNLIYTYPFLPEARARKVILARPPGNHYDS